MVDYNVKMDDIKSDFYSSIAKFNIVKDAYEKKGYVVLPSDDYETREIKKHLEKEILADMGRAAELFFKYIVKIERLRLFPNEPYESDQNTKGFKDKETLGKPVINEIANKLHAPSSKVDNILAVEGVGPKAHNFNYVYRIIENLFPDINNSFVKFIELIAKSKIAEKELVEGLEGTDLYDVIEYIMFPESIKIDEKNDDENKRKILNRINARISTIDYSGDIFNRLRFFSNDPGDKTFNIDEIFELISEIKIFCESIHISGEKTYLSPQLLFANYIINQKSEYNRFSQEELNKILESKKIEEDPLSLITILFYSDMTIDEILDVLSLDLKKFVDFYGYSPVFSNHLTKETIQYFYNLGIYDFDEMDWWLRKRGLINAIFGDKYSLEEFERLRVELCNNTNDLSNIVLLGRLSENSIKELLKYPKFLEYFKTKFSANINAVSYNFNDKDFSMILKNEEVRKNPESLYGLDYDQLNCYIAFSDIISSNPLNNSALNPSNVYYDTMNYHITENIKKYSYNKQLLCVLPLRLDPYDIDYILNILIQKGLNIDDLRGLDTTILCMPPALVNALVQYLDKTGKQLIVNNNVNPAIYEAIEMLKKSYNSNVEIEKRRIPFHKCLLGNPNDEMAQALMYEDSSDYDFEVTEEEKRAL